MTDPTIKLKKVIMENDIDVLGFYQCYSHENCKDMVTKRLNIGIFIVSLVCTFLSLKNCDAYTIAVPFLTSFVLLLSLISIITSIISSADSVELILRIKDEEQISSVLNALEKHHLVTHTMYKDISSNTYILKTSGNYRMY